MLSLDLNLASRPFKNNVPLWAGLAAAAIALVVFSIYNVTTYGEYAERLADLDAKLARVETELAEIERRERAVQREIEKVDLAFLNAKVQKANEVIRWKAFSWTRLFNLLQGVQPGDVQMSAVRPLFRPDEQITDKRSIKDPEVIQVSVEGTARRLEDFLAFERRLIDDPHFARPEPEHTDTDEQSRETLFRLQFWYDPRVVGDGRSPGPEPAGAAAAEAEAEAAAGTQAAAEPAADAARTVTAAAPVAAPAAPAPAGETPRKRGGGRRKKAIEAAAAEAGR